MLLQELKDRPQWVICRADKVPLRVSDGRNASPVDSRDWSTYEAAAAACAGDSELYCGYVLSANDPFCVIDLDYTDDPHLQYNQKQILDNFETYTEYSMSGKGVHVWCKSAAPNKKFTGQKIEIYSHSRFIACTFKPVKDLPINACGHLITELVTQYDKAVKETVHPTSLPETLSDQQVCIAAANATNGELFKSLYLGKWQDKFPSQSEADLALCNIIAFYTDNIQQVARIFRASTLGQRKKAQRDDYLFNPRWGIVQKAFDNKVAQVDFSKLAEEWQPDYASENNLEEDYEELYKIDWTMPTGLLGEIINFIYSSSVYPVPEVAIAAAIGFMAGLCGRAYNTSTHTGLNQYIILLADTGSGKEGAARGIGQLSKAILTHIPAFIQFIGPSEISSPQALLKHLAAPNQQCFLSHKSEVGLWMQKMNAKYAKSNELLLKALILDLFHKSGDSDVLQGAIYADQQKNVPAIHSPSLSILGDSTPQEFFRALSESNIREGLVSRFTVINTQNYNSKYNEFAGIMRPPAELIAKLCALVQRCLEFNKMERPKIVEETSEAKEFQLGYQDECHKKVLLQRGKASSQIWHRAHIRLLRLGSLIAVGNNPDYPVVQLQDYLWARACIEHGVYLMISRFERGEIGEESLYVDQKNDLLEFLRKFYKSQWEPKLERSYKITYQMWKDKAIPYAAVQQLAGRLSSFRNDKNPSWALHKMLDDFVLSGWIVKALPTQVQMYGKRGDVYGVTHEIVKAR